MGCQFFGANSRANLDTQTTGGYETFKACYPSLCQKGALSGHVYPAVIDNHVYLASDVCSQDKEVLDCLNIKYILNVTTEVRNAFEEETSGLKYRRIPVVDSETEQIANYFGPAKDFIDEAERHNCSVLVHCAQGASRSPTVVCAYLMLKHRWDMQRAYAHVQKARPIVRINPGFKAQLQRFQKEQELNT